VHLTDQQQKAIAGLLGDLKNEITELKKAATTVKQGATNVTASAQAVDGAVSGVLPALTQAAGMGATRVRHQIV